MTALRSEDILVGLIGAAMVPWIGWIIRRGFRDGKLPIGRAYVLRAERPGAFQVLIALYSVAAVAVLVMAADLLFNLNLRNR